MLNLIPKIPAVNPAEKTILYADSLPLTIDKIHRIPLSAFMALYTEKTGRTFVYTDNIVATHEVKASYPSARAPFGPSLNDSTLLRALKNQEDIIIANMGKFGFGAFANKRFKKDETIAIYSGELKLGKMSSVYVLESKDGGIDSLEHGNVARFFQHCPFRFNSASTLRPGSIIPEQYWDELINIMPEQEKDLATANLAYGQYYFGKFPVPIFIAVCEIPQYALLSFDYGIAYWFGRTIMPQLFYQNGLPIPSRVYKYTRAPIIKNSLTSEAVSFQSDLLIQGDRENWVRESMSWSHNPNFPKISRFLVLEKMVANNALAPTCGAWELNEDEADLKKLFNLYLFTMKVYALDPSAEVEGQPYRQKGTTIVLQTAFKPLLMTMLNAIGSDVKIPISDKGYLTKTLSCLAHADTREIIIFCPTPADHKKAIDSLKGMINRDNVKVALEEESSDINTKLFNIPWQKVDPPANPFPDISRLNINEY